jgi:hypothetical protein
MMPNDPVIQLLSLCIVFGLIGAAVCGFMLARKGR